jgi:hypothetical protein
MLRMGIAFPALMGASITDLVTTLDTLWRQDVTPLAVGKQQQRNVRGAIRIVLDALDPGGYAGLVALEIDDTITLLVSTTAMPRGDTTGIVTASGPGLCANQR